MKLARHGPKGHGNSHVRIPVLWVTPALRSVTTRRLVCRVTHPTKLREQYLPVDRIEVLHDTPASADAFSSRLIFTPISPVGCQDGLTGRLSWPLIPRHCPWSVTWCGITCQEL